MDGLHLFRAPTNAHAEGFMTVFDSSGDWVQVGSAAVRTQGLAGRAEQLPLRRGSGRVTRARANLETALRLQGFRAEPALVMTARPRATRGVEAQKPVVEVRVPGPPAGHGQVLLHTDEHGVASWILPREK